MNTQHSFQTSKPLNLLDALLRASRLLLIFVSMLAIPLMVLAASGRGTITVKGTVTAPFTVEFDNGTRIGVNGGSLSYENFEIGRERVLADAPTIDASVNLERDDLDSRIIVIAIASLWLASAWVGLVSMRGIVLSARRGEWLPGENPVRLRRLAGSILAYGATGLIGQWLLNGSVESAVPFEVTIAVSTWLTALVLGLAVLALAEPFAEAARLREFEASAI